jgi:rfaE bifunctional protein nucleotidyltransferase chain/domain
MMDKVIDISNLKRFSEMGGLSAHRVVTNGCFDIIHSGHVDYLSKAKELGDVLIVGLNGDESVRKLKGEGRPINNEMDRAKVLAAFSFVDYICIFKEEKATNFLKAAMPDTYVKAGDYSLETLDISEKCVLNLYGSYIKFIPFTEGKSTTNILSGLNHGK